MQGFVSDEGSLERAVERDALWASLQSFLAEGLADESEKSQLVLALTLRGERHVRERLLARRELLAAASSIMDDFFAFEAAAKQG